MTRWMVEIKVKNPLPGGLEWGVYSIYDIEEDARTSARVQSESGNPTRVSRVEPANEA